MNCEDQDDGVFRRPREQTKKSNRRSSFFQRRLSSRLLDSDCSSPTSSISLDNVNKDEVSNTQSSKIAKYTAKLEKECADWDHLLAELQKENKTLQQKKSEVLDSSRWLTPEQKDFLGQRPDMVALGRMMDQATEAVGCKHLALAATGRSVRELVDSSKQTITELTKKVIDHTMRHTDELDDLVVSPSDCTDVTEFFR